MFLKIPADAANILYMKDIVLLVSLIEKSAAAADNTEQMSDNTEQVSDFERQTRKYFGRNAINYNY